jgi:hypothetical protein
VIALRHQMRVASTDPGSLQVRWVKIRECAVAIVAVQNLAPVTVLYLDRTQPLMQSG